MDPRARPITTSRLAFQALAGLGIGAIVALAVALIVAHGVIKEIENREQESLLSALSTGPVALAHLQAATISQEHLDRLMSGYSGFGNRGTLKVRITGGPGTSDIFAAWESPTRDTIPLACRKLIERSETPAGALFPFLVQMETNQCLYSKAGGKWVASILAAITLTIGFFLLTSYWVVRPVIQSFRTSTLILGGTVEGLNAGSVSFAPLKRLTEVAIAYRRMRHIEALGQLARQISHDIRAPIAAIDAALRSSAQMEPDARGLVEAAILAIRGMTDDLLARYRESGSPTHYSSDLSIVEESKQAKNALRIERVHVYEAVEKSFELFAIQHKLDAKLVLGKSFTEIAFGKYALIDETQLVRSLNNLLQNSIEAVTEKAQGNIHVSLSSTDAELILEVSDNGKGIPEGLLSRVVEKGGTFGKAAGNGLGLSFARDAAANWGGQLTIASSFGVGTQVKLSIPLQGPQLHLPHPIQFEDLETVIVIDDDATVHRLWETVFSSRFPSKCPSVVHCHSTDEGLQWFRDNLDAPKSLYLCDYNFGNPKENGLDFIDKLGIRQVSVLVTASWDEPEVQERAHRLGIPILPKDRISSFLFGPYVTPPKKI